MVALLATALLAAACSPTGPNPGPTQLVAAATSGPEVIPSGAPRVPAVASPAPTGLPSGEPAPSETPLSAPSAIVAGTVDRSSLKVTATYRVNATITVATGALDVTTLISARNDSGDGIDRLELNTIAAKLGAMRITEASVEDHAVTARVQDQTILVPLGGILPDGASTTVRLTYHASLRKGLTGDDWRFSRSGETLALSRWIPWVSRATPFDRPNNGEPFVTAASPQVDIELLTDEPMTLAAPALDVAGYAAGDGNDWAFTVRDVRDVSVVLAPDFQVSSGKAGSIPVRAYTRPGGLSGTQLVKQAVAAINAQAKLLGVAYPSTTLTVVETEGGVGLESPGLLWVPHGLTSLNREYAVYQGAAQQWFYGLVGNDQRAEPFADEAPSDLLARTVLHSLRATRCSRQALDLPLPKYSSRCYYEVVNVQGGLVLDELRKKIGTARFWRAMAAYLEANRNAIGGTRQLLEALRAASPVDLLPILRARFPTLY